MTEWDEFSGAHTQGNVLSLGGAQGYFRLKLAAPMNGATMV